MRDVLPLDVSVHTADAQLAVVIEALSKKQREGGRKTEREKRRGGKGKEREKKTSALSLG